MNLVTPESMREMDRRTIEGIGVPSPILMDRAARGAVDALLDYFALSDGARIGLLCGTGNNGGDGLAMATILVELGFEVDLVVLGEEDSLSDDAALYYRIATKLIGPITLAATEEKFEQRLAQGLDCDLWCDALLGTGLDRPLGGRYARAVQFLSDQSAPVMAIDIPTGLDGHTGQVLGSAARAELTATFGFAKTGQFLDPARSYCGDLAVVDIGIPQRVQDEVGFEAIALDGDWLINNLPRRAQNAHKGSAGKTLHIGGKAETAGAIALSAQAALVGGAGLITVATEAAAQPHISGRTPEIMSRRAFDSAKSTLDKASLSDALDRAETVVIGPGLGTDELSLQIFEHTIEASPEQLIVDADALNLLSTHADLRGRFNELAASKSVVITPHPGEAARQLDCEIDDILADPVSAAKKLRDEFSATAVLKTAATVVAGTPDQLAINATGNPGMATGGMGDALTGLIAAAFADSDGDPFKAACQAVVVHGLAGDLQASKSGHRGLTVTALLDAVPHVWQSVE